jgi:hypothetical protein
MTFEKETCENCGGNLKETSIPEEERSSFDFECEDCGYPNSEGMYV